MDKRHFGSAGTGIRTSPFGGLHLHPATEGGGSAVAELKPLTDPDITDKTTMEGLRGEIGKITQAYNGIIHRLASGVYVSKDEITPLQQSEEKLLRQVDTIQQIVNANAGRFHGHQADNLTLMKAALVLEPDDELKGLDRTYFNLMTLHPEELAGLASIGARWAPGVAGTARRWAKEVSGLPSIQRHLRLQQLNDALYIKDFLLSRTNDNYKRLRLSGIESAMQTLAEWDEYKRLYTEFSRALDESATGTKGGYLVPVILSNRIGDIKEGLLRIVNLFGKFTMTSKTFEWPFLGAHITMYAPGEFSFDHATYAAPPTNAITASEPAFVKPTWTANKLAGLTFMSTELDEDAITPMLPWLEGEMARSMAHSEEDAYINGEKAGVSMDGATFNPAGSSRRYVNGLRFHALMTGSYPATKDAGNAAVTNTMGIQLQELMGAWGVEPEDFVWASGYKGYHSLRLIQDFWTLEKMGPQAVLLTGQVGAWLGSPVIRTEKLVPLNAAGKYDGVTQNRGSILGADRTRWATGERRGVTIDTSEHVAFRSDQLAVRGTQRGDFQPMDTPSATKTPVGIIFNIA